jgi:dihydrodipicolinate synthase/N-acetylneuraminate lyase
MEKEIKGVLPALITPFTDTGEVDGEKLKAFLRFLIPQVHGLFPCGSYGSGPLMTVSQRKMVAEIITEEVSGKIPVLLHVGTADTKTTIELAEHAEDLKVSAVACLTPYYYLHNYNTVTEHFRRVIDAVNVPVYLYHNPKYTHFLNFSPAQLAELADIGLAGLKDSSANITFFYDCVSAVNKPDFTFLIGSQTVLMPALLGGGCGCISGLSNLFPKLVNSIYDKVLEGKLDEALDLQRKANVLRKVTGEGIPVPFYHAALKLRGIDIGVPKAPHLPFAKEDEERIRQPILDAIELEESL